jgi:hypothetical protein
MNSNLHSDPFHRFLDVEIMATVGMVHPQREETIKFFLCDPVTNLSVFFLEVTVGCVAINKNSAKNNQWTKEGL